MEEKTTKPDKPVLYVTYEARMTGEEFNRFVELLNQNALGGHLRMSTVVTLKGRPFFADLEE